MLTLFLIIETDTGYNTMTNNTTPCSQYPVKQKRNEIQLKPTDCDFMTVTRTSKKTIRAVPDGSANKFPINVPVPTSQCPAPFARCCPLAVEFQLFSTFKSNFANRNLWSLGLPVGWRFHFIPSYCSVSDSIS